MFLNSATIFIFLGLANYQNILSFGLSNGQNQLTEASFQEIFVGTHALNINMGSILCAGAEILS